MSPSDRAKVNDYIVRSFRDVADADYIAARSIYRLGLSQQFLWAALQALEKYLKGILLFNDLSTKTIGHDIASAYAALSQISDIIGQVTPTPERSSDTNPRTLGWVRRVKL